MIPALGCRSRPSASRTSPRKSSWIFFHTPSFFHAVKYLKTEFHGGKSCGKSRQTQPDRATYRMASTTSRREYFAGRPPGFGTGTDFSISFHSASVVSDGSRSHRHLRP
jgi:hypothetical protein